MGEVHILGAPHTADAPAGERLRRLLEQALHEGRDLGPRGDHIAALVRSLDGLLARLRAGTSLSAALLETDEPEAIELERATLALIDQVERLTDYCWRTYVA